MVQSLFFWSHDHPEGGAADESKSKYNDEEAKMAVRLAKHLLLQASIHYAHARVCEATACKPQRNHVQCRGAKALDLTFTVQIGRKPVGLQCEGQQYMELLYTVYYSGI